MKKRYTKLAGYSLKSTTTMNSNEYSSLSKQLRVRLQLAKNKLRRAALNIQRDRVLRMTTRSGVAPLVPLILEGYPFVIDESGRLWVYHPNVTIE